MIKTRKIIFYFAIVFILLILTILILTNFFPIEFTKNADEIFFDQLLFLGLPIAILLTLVQTLKKKDAQLTKITKIVFTVALASAPILFSFASALSFLCGWYTNETLFENKNDHSTKIVLREFGCGAVDSGTPKHGTFKIKYLTSHFIWVTEIDTSKINKQIWIRVVNKE